MRFILRDEHALNDNFGVPVVGKHPCHSRWGDLVRPVHLGGDDIHSVGELVQKAAPAAPRQLIGQRPAAADHRGGCQSGGSTAPGRIETHHPCTGITSKSGWQSALKRRFINGERPWVF